MTKVCSKCGKEKSEDSFLVEKRVKSGLTAKCKQCFYDYTKLWREKHPSQARKLRRVGYEKRKTKPEYKEYQKEYRKKYAEKKSDIIKGKDKIRYLKNRDKALARNKKYVEENKEKIRQSKKIYNANNKSKLVAQKKEYYIKNKQKITDRNKEYVKNNRDKVKARKNKWRLDNPDKPSIKFQKKNKPEYIKKWRSDNRERIISKKRKIIADIEPTYSVRLLKMEGFPESAITPDLIELKKVIVGIKRKLRAK